MSPEEEQQKQNDYHITVVQQNATNNELLRQLVESSKEGHRVTKDSVDSLTRSVISNIFKFPVAALIIVCSTYAFALGKITENTWIVMFLVASAPWFGEWLPIIIRHFIGKGGGDRK